MYQHDDAVSVLDPGKLNLVDLAGSESLRKGGETNEDRLAETRSINSSLAALGKVVMDLSTGGVPGTGGARHVPFRDSKLTRVLKVPSHLFFLLLFRSRNLYRLHADIAL